MEGKWWEGKETIEDIQSLPDSDGRQLVASGVTPSSIGRRNLHTLLDMRDLDPKIKKYLEDRRIELYNLYHQTSPEFRRGANYLWDLHWNPNGNEFNQVADAAARAWGPGNSVTDYIPSSTGHSQYLRRGPRARGTPPSPDPAFNINPGQTQYNAVLNVRNPEYAPDAQNPIMYAVRRRRREARSGPDPNDPQGNPYMLEDRPLPPGLRGARSSQSYEGQGVGSREHFQAPERGPTTSAAVSREPQGYQGQGVGRREHFQVRRRRPTTRTSGAVSREPQGYQGQGVGRRESLRGGGRRKTTKKRQRGGSRSKKRAKRSKRKNR